jgi:FG-GAP repeat
MSLRFALLLLFVTTSLKAAPPVVLRGFGPGLAESQLQHASLQMVMAAQNLRQACNTVPGTYAGRMQILLYADRALSFTKEFHALTLRPANAGQLVAADRQMDAGFVQLTALLQPVLPGNPGLGQTLNQVQFADAQLHTILGGNGNDPRLNVVRLANATADQGEELRAVLMDVNSPFADRNLLVQLRTFNTRSRQIAAAAEGGANTPQLSPAYGAMAQLWVNIGPALNRAASVNARVRLQAARVESLYRDLGAAINGTPPVPDPGFGIVAPSSRVLVVGAGEGGGPHVKVFQEVNGPSTDFFAYDVNYQGGVRVAVADLNGDGFPEIVTAPGRDMAPLIRVFDGRTLNLIQQFIAYDAPYDLGCYITAADLTPNNRALIAVAPGTGGPPHVKVFDLVQGKMIDEIYPYPRELRCGVRVAFGDVNGDGYPDLITAPGPGNGPHIKVLDGRNGQLLKEFNAFDDRYRGGVFVAAADITRNGRAEIIVGMETGGIMSVYDPLTGRRLSELAPYGVNFRGGIRVATFDANQNGIQDLIVAPGPGQRNMPIRVYDGRNARLLTDFVPFENFPGGAYIGGR